MITNRRKPTLTVTKVLVPANDPGTFGLQIDGQTKATGGNGTTTGQVELSSGAHTVAEVAAGSTDLNNYVSSIGGDCLADGSVSLAAGENKTCTITNTRKARLFVIKKVVNDNGGTAVPSDFTLAVNATDPTPASFKGADTPGVEVTLAPGAYSVAETGGPAGYTGSFSAACTGTIALGETKTCTVTNDDQPAKLIVKKIVINDNGGTKTAADFSFKVNDGSATAVRGRRPERPDRQRRQLHGHRARSSRLHHHLRQLRQRRNRQRRHRDLHDHQQRPAREADRQEDRHQRQRRHQDGRVGLLVQGQRRQRDCLRGRRSERPHGQRRQLHGHRARSSRLHHHLRQLQQRCSRERRHRDLHDHQQRPAREADRQEDRHQRQRRHCGRVGLLVQAQRRQRGCLRGRRPERPDRQRRQLLGHRARSSRLHHHLRQLRQRRNRQRRDRDLHDHQQRPARQADRHQARRQRQRR